MLSKAKSAFGGKKLMAILAIATITLPSLAISCRSGNFCLKSVVPIKKTSLKEIIAYLTYDKKDSAVEEIDGDEFFTLENGDCPISIELSRVAYNDDALSYYLQIFFFKKVPTPNAITSAFYLHDVTTVIFTYYPNRFNSRRGSRGLRKISFLNTGSKVVSLMKIEIWENGIVEVSNAFYK